MVPLNPNVVKAEYAVRGELALRAEQLRTLLATTPKQHHKLPFTRIVNCNIGNPQQLGQPPISFFRRVLAAVECPELLSSCGDLFKKDVIKRAKELLEMVGSTGAYSHSKGVPGIRQQVAQFLSNRDNCQTDAEHIYLTNGASEGISRVLQLFATGPSVGVLIPIPQYPLYAATIALLGAQPVPYYLDEERQWTLTADQLTTSISNAPSTVTPRILCVINPGNPTGNCLSEADIYDILRTAKQHNLIVLFDEVYQANWYQPNTHFTSARSVKHKHPEFAAVPLFSFHSCSKGLLGECGKRGAFFHYDGDDLNIHEQLYKLASISLCPNLQGQLLVSLMVSPPKPGDDSHEEYCRETMEIFESLRRRSIKLCDAFNAMQGVSCQPAMVPYTYIYSYIFNYMLIA